jgi:DNA polymerase I-like protein with 3'-5' exonuclease and polymerase domains
MVGDLKGNKKAMFAIKEMMEHPFPTDLDVPLGVSIGHGVNWLNAK